MVRRKPDVAVSKSAKPDHPRCGFLEYIFGLINSTIVVSSYSNSYELVNVMAFISLEYINPEEFVDKVSLGNALSLYLFGSGQARHSNIWYTDRPSGRN
ncbi:hypothetical protein ACTXT7_007151 [Hymenolepis weldensis]